MKPMRSVIVEFPAQIFAPYAGCLVSVFDAETGEQIRTIREVAIYANADLLVGVSALHIPDPWPDGTERTEEYQLAGVRVRP